MSDSEPEVRSRETAVDPVPQDAGVEPASTHLVVAKRLLTGVKGVLSLAVGVLAAVGSWGRWLLDFVFGVLGRTQMDPEALTKAYRNIENGAAWGVNERVLASASVVLGVGVAYTAFQIGGGLLTFVLRRLDPWPEQLLLGVVRRLPRRANGPTEVGENAPVDVGERGQGAGTSKDDASSGTAVDEAGQMDSAQATTPELALPRDDADAASRSTARMANAEADEADGISVFFSARDGSHLVAVDGGAAWSSTKEERQREVIRRWPISSAAASRDGTLLATVANGHLSLSWARHAPPFPSPFFVGALPPESDLRVLAVEPKGSKDEWVLLCGSVEEEGPGWYLVTRGDLRRCGGVPDAVQDCLVGGQVSFDLPDPPSPGVRPTGACVADGFVFVDGEGATWAVEPASSHRAERVKVAGSEASKPWSVRALDAVDCEGKTLVVYLLTDGTGAVPGRVGIATCDHPGDDVEPIWLEYPASSLAIARGHGGSWASVPVVLGLVAGPCVQVVEAGTGRPIAMALEHGSQFRTGHHTGTVPRSTDAVGRPAPEVVRHE